MAGNTKTTALAALALGYDREGYIAKHERNMCPFYTTVKSWPGKPLYGRSKNWAIKTKNSHAAAVIAEGGDYPTDAGQSWMLASVTPVEIAGSATITELLAVIGQSQEWLGGETDAAQTIVKDCIKDALVALNRQTIGDPSGVIGIVASTTDTSTTVPLAFPDGSFRFRNNFGVDFFNQRSGGAKQGNSQTADFVDYRTPSLTIDAARTLTADWVVVRTGEYGISLEGLQAICDDGDLTSTLFGLTRSTNPDINALDFPAGSGLQPWSEDLVDQAFIQLTQIADVEPDAIWCNDGIPVAHRRALSGSRILMGPNGEVPQYGFGHNTDQMFYQYNGRKVPFKIDRDLPARTAWLVTGGYFRKYSPKELDWTGDGISPSSGSASPIWLQMPGSAAGTYASKKGAFVNAFVSIGHLQPKLNARIEGIVDTVLCNDEL